jgi:hypothetical protein
LSPEIPVVGADQLRGGFIVTRIIVTSKVGPDGVLHLTLPVGLQEADKEVQVTVEPIARQATTQDEWRVFILATAGTWRGDLERPEQGELQERELLS